MSQFDVQLCFKDVYFQQSVDFYSMYPSNVPLNTCVSLKGKSKIHTDKKCLTVCERFAAGHPVTAVNNQRCLAF